MAGEASIRSDYAELLTSSDSAIVNRALQALAVDVHGVLTVIRSAEGARQFAGAAHAVEGVLVALLGHASPRPRGMAVRLLNALYDGIDWQLADAHVPIIAEVGQALTVDVYTAYTLPTVAGATPGAANEAFRVAVCAPSFLTDGGAAEAGAEQVLTLHAPRVTTEEVWVAIRDDGAPATAPAPAGDATSPSSGLRYLRTTVTHIHLTLAPFPRCGFYDWRVVTVDMVGTVKPIAAVTPLTPDMVARLAASGQLPADADGTSTALVPMSPTAVMASNGGRISSPLPPRGLAQGRFIVHRMGQREEHYHEVICDLEGMKFTPGGDIVKHGTFDDVGNKLAEWKGAGVTSVYLLGALERDNGWGESDAAAAAASGSSTVGHPGAAPAPTAAGLAALPPSTSFADLHQPHTSGES